MKGNIIVFRFKEKTEQKSINQFCKKFYGQNTSSHGGKYQYRRHGLLDNIPHIKLIGGVRLWDNIHLNPVPWPLRFYVIQSLDVAYPSDIMSNKFQLGFSCFPGVKFLP
jgi:hypothetical protein